MSEHVCTVCYRASEAHPERSEDCDEWHFPALCCVGCECRSWEQAHSLPFAVPRDEEDR